MRKNIFGIVIFCCTVLLCQADKQNCNWEKNPWTATVLATRDELKADLPSVEIHQLSLKKLHDREIPECFWYQKEFKYSAVFQDKPAPLVFCIAGTGSSYNSGNIIHLQRACYKAGFHAIGLSSPTHMNFILTASTTGIPGRLDNDAADMYSVMKKIVGKLPKKVKVTEYYLTGYSLGAAHSAFIAKHDEKEKVFDFKKVVMLNPTVNLMRSVRLLDNLVPPERQTREFFHEFLDKAVQRLSHVYRPDETLDFSSEFLYRAYNTIRPADIQLKQLIWTSFRLSCMNMLFTVDVNNKLGLVVPKSVDLSPYDAFTGYLRQASGYGYEDAFKAVVFPEGERLGQSKESIEKNMTIESLEKFLAENNKIEVMTNEDEIILTETDFEFLKRTFGKRLNLYPYGGHCGTLQHYRFTKDMLDIFKSTKGGK